MPDEEMRNVAVTETFPPPHHAPPMADELRAQLQKHEQAPEPIMQFFAYEHLPLNLQTASKPFCVLANQLVAELPRSAERTVALRKLLESKDAAVRARIAK